MPTYDYACSACGPFEIWRDHREAGTPLRCPACGGSADRHFCAPGLRAPGDPFHSASRDVRARAERARTGEPVTSYGALPGRPVSGGHHHGGAQHGNARGAVRAPARPWQVGH
jgi:putative FmdB family regulatory protein